MEENYEVPSWIFTHGTTASYFELLHEKQTLLQGAASSPQNANNNSLQAIGMLLHTLKTHRTKEIK
jgi:hypothetical protein